MNPRAPSIIDVIASVAAAFFGVQSSRNRVRDFTYGRPWHYVAVATVMTGVVSLAFYGAAQLALALAG